ncbi:MAG: type II toxin-antitoxin system ParD family antitoxin [Chitinophagales bacterium]
MNVSLTKSQEEYIAEQLKSGDFQNASEVIRDAMRLHKYYRQKTIEQLRLDIEKGWEGATSDRNVLDILKAKVASAKK